MTSGDISRNNYGVKNNFGVRPVTVVSNTAKMTGSGTQASPYVITVSQ